MTQQPLGPDHQPLDRPEDAATVLFVRRRKRAEEQGFHRLRRMPKNSSLTADPRQTQRAASSQNPGSSADLRDPALLGSAMKGLIRSRGWSAPVAVGSVITRWEQLMGPAIAEHCHPESFENGVVVVVCDSTAWATNLKLMQTQVMEMFDRELGSGIVTRLDIRGPRPPSWKKGKLSVRGRGPRDTYG